MRKRAMGCEFTISNSDGVKVDHAKKNELVKVHQSKERWAES